MFPLSYSIPSEKVCVNVPEKKHILADLIPGNLKTYRFGKGEETEYYQMYRDSRFAIDMKKCGWDSLRHYEIIANGCIPIFDDISSIPDGTMTTFPKEILQQAYKDLLPWKNNVELYNTYVEKLLNHCREYQTCEKSAEYFLKKIGATNDSKILMLHGHPGVNYTRECLSIGLRRLLGSNFIDFPKNLPLYKNCENIHEYYGYGYTYGKTLDDINIDRENIQTRIRNQEFDFIIYAKFGIEEGPLGNLPTCLYWNDVYDNYSREKIIFLFGGDSQRPLSDSDNIFTRHMISMVPYGLCFCRELHNFPVSLER